MWSSSRNTSLYGDKQMRKNKLYDHNRKKKDGETLYIFGERLKQLMADNDMTARMLADRIVKNGGDVTIEGVRKWTQHYIFPSERNLTALCKVFYPYSAEYFRGVVEAPDYHYQYIMDETGLTWEAIENIKKISKKYKDTLNAVLKSEYIEDIVQCIESSKGEKHTVLREEYVALDYLKDYIDFFDTVSDKDKNLIKHQLDSIHRNIERLSDEEINKPFKGKYGDSTPAFEISAYKLGVQYSFDTLFDNEVPKLKSLHYSDLIDIYNKFIKPTESFKSYSEDNTESYRAKVLAPLKEILVQEKIGQYHTDNEKDEIILNKETQKKISALYEKAQKIIEASGNVEPEKPTKKRSQRKKV